MTPLRTPTRTRIAIKRVYDEPTEADGVRILVERLWPRGLRKSEARIDVWLKDIAPSTALRQWYAHDVERWPEFKRRYEAELRKNPDAVRTLTEYCKPGRTTTFVYAAHDEEHNSAIALRDFMRRRLRQSSASMR